MARKRTTAESKSSSPPPEGEDSVGGMFLDWRETVESIVVAVILALLFRMFEAEAFVIPTGSMAPTLMGAHKDVIGPTGIQYQVGDSQVADPTVGGFDPISRQPQPFFPEAYLEHSTYSGDRILVNKLAYDFADPQRWDVIVFKFPDFDPPDRLRGERAAYKNYIKRLIGLPGETIQIREGDIYVRRRGEDTFEIARKPPHKQLATMQIVHDTAYRSKLLDDYGWPERWQPLAGAPSWERDEKTFAFQVKASPKAMQWLRYNHWAPLPEDWQYITSGVESTPTKSRAEPRLIKDYCYYNAKFSGADDLAPNGVHWVSDLAVEVECAILSDSGTLALDLVEGGTHHTCRIDVATGEASVQLNGKSHTKKTAIVGAGVYRLRWSNIDNVLRLWVNDSWVEFEQPLTFETPPNMAPVYSPEDGGDLRPVGIGMSGGEVRCDRLRVLRDIYYIATTSPDPEYRSDWLAGRSRADIVDALDDYENWPPPGSVDPVSAFTVRNTLTLPALGDDHFLPMGDNSDRSSDARMWSETQYVERRLLIGKAFLIYWPHPWYNPLRLNLPLPGQEGWGLQPIPVTPNFGRFKRIQ